MISKVLDQSALREASSDSLDLAEGGILLDKEIVLEMTKGLIVLHRRVVGIETRIHSLLLLDCSRKSRGNTNRMVVNTPNGWRSHEDPCFKSAPTKTKHPSEKQGWKGKEKR
ncbi:unnamed protein product [Linum trigynum]|uniref:Uncharacterized protein n=1 Tax=Linum trigynum TaxID=586398 RepID=A0AAV2E0M7_9ROSI